MIKESRKRAVNPEQEHLRQSKQDWNKEVSEFISDMIQYKKLINGNTSKFRAEKSKITSPLPSESSAVLSDLVSRFQELATSAKDIIQEQISYSEKAPNLTREASNAVSRFFSKVKGPYWGNSPGARKRRYRINLLNLAVELEKNADRFKDKLVDVSDASYKNSVFEAEQFLKKIITNFDIFRKVLSSYIMQADKSELVEEKQEAEKSEDKQEEKKIEDKTNKVEKKETTSPNLESKVKLLLSDYFDNINLLDFDSALNKKMLELRSKLEAQYSPDLAEELVSTYKKSLEFLLNKYNDQASSFLELRDKQLKKAFADPIFSKFARNPLSKWLDKIQQNTYLNKINSAVRKDLYFQIKHLKELLDKLMDSLEKDLNPYEMNSFISDMGHTLDVMKNLFDVLAKKDRYGVDPEEYLSLLSNKELFDQHYQLDNDDEKRLKRLLKTKQLRELSRLVDKK